MKCEICGLKDAVIHIRQIQKDLVHELHICEECAQEKGLIREEDSELPIANLLSGLLEGKDVTGAAEVKDACPRCGLKASDFRKQGIAESCFAAGYRFSSKPNRNRNNYPKYNQPYYRVKYAWKRHSKPSNIQLKSPK